MGLDQDSLREVIKRIASTFSQDPMLVLVLIKIIEGQVS